VTSTLTNRPALTRALHWAGSGLALAGVIFIGLRLYDYRAKLDFSQFGTSAWLVIAGLTLFYGLCNLLLALAWWNLLQQFDANVSRRWAIKNYGISQLAKYVPGNIFHLAGRQAMGMSAGVPGWVLVKSSAWELGLISVAGVVLGLLTLPLLIPGLPIATGGIACVATALIGTRVLAMHAGRYGSRAFGWYLGFLAMSGLAFAQLVALERGEMVIHFDETPLLVGAYVLAWLIGMITPGAPAGVGVRELVLLFLLVGTVSESDLVLALLVGRIITLMGDFLFFVSAHGMRLAPTQTSP
jgi:hypothetical protein